MHPLAWGHVNGSVSSYEPVIHATCTSASLTNNNRSTPMAPTAWLQHTHPSTVGARKGSQEGISLELLLIREIVQLEHESCDMYVPAQQTTNIQRSTPKVPTAWLPHAQPSTVGARKGSQEGTYLELLLVREIVQLEPVSSMQHASAQRTKLKRSATTAPTARLQHTYPSALEAKKGSQEGTSLKVLLVREKVQVQRTHVFSDILLPGLKSQSSKMWQVKNEKSQK
jgi:hypothetical protein